MNFMYTCAFGFVHMAQVNPAIDWSMVWTEKNDRRFVEREGKNYTFLLGNEVYDVLD